jgi:hypothetical protein
MITLPKRGTALAPDDSCPVVALRSDYHAWTPAGSDRQGSANQGSANQGDPEATRREAMRQHPSNSRRMTGAAQDTEARVTGAAQYGQGREVGAAQSGADKLRVLVSLDSNLDSAQVNVRGSVTVTNLCALYAILSRTNEFMPGMDISVDLSSAQACPEAVRELQAVARNRALPVSSVTGAVPRDQGIANTAGTLAGALPLRLQIRTATNG